MSIQFVKEVILIELVSRIRPFVYRLLNSVYLIPTGRKMVNGVARWVNRRSIAVDINGTTLHFLAGLGASEWRASTLHRKEPETLDWIDSFESGSTFWDIGASTGVYTIYAAVRKHCKVVAFDLLPINYDIQIQNAQLNNVGELVLVVPLALNDHSGPVNAGVIAHEIGTSQHQLQPSSEGSIKLQKQFHTVALSIDECVQTLNFPKPDYIKIDVDGLEHLIIKGGQRTLDSNVKSVLVEKQNNLESRRRTVSLLTNLNFKLTLESKGNFIWSRHT